jgi:hypothetical protein
MYSLQKGPTLLLKTTQRDPFPDRKSSQLISSPEKRHQLTLPERPRPLIMLPLLINV